MKTLTKKSISKWWKSVDRTTKILFFSVAGASVVIAGVGAYIVTCPLPNDVVPPKPVEAETVYRNPLNGEVILEPLVPAPRVFGVMIENSADAWPLAGLEDASLVIEAPVEGNIPRFIAFFSELDETEKIGPVCLARPYYLDWNDELDAIYGHVGGSQEALDLILAYGTRDLNEFFQGEYYYRWGKRSAPHNAYTTIADLRGAIDELQPGEPVYDSWMFREHNLETESELSLDIDWTGGTTYDVRWEYGLLTHTYERRQGGAQGFTNLTEGGSVVAENIVVMEADISVIDDVGRRHIVTVGQGKAYIAQDGEITIGTWKKDGRTERLRFYDETGTEMAMVAGKTWIEVVPSLSQVTIVDPIAQAQVDE